MNGDDRLFSHDLLETDILYIIGNGFDCKHQICSAYSNFEQWCKDNKRNIMLFDALFSTQQDFWNDIETALGDYDEKEILEFCMPDEEFDYEHSLSASARIEDAPMSILKPALDDLRECFVEWVNSISLADVVPFLNLSANAKYITFNYTETLENIYKIPSDNICHIHGNRLLSNGQYIFGHNAYKRYNGAYSDLPLYEENAYLSIFEYMNEFQKPINKIIDANKPFFENLTDTKLVYILGHSLSEIDKTYFSYILSQFKQQPRFIISYYTVKDIENINRFITENKINTYRIICIDELKK